MKKLLVSLTLLATILTVGCQTDASKASYNLSKAAEMFELDRRVVFYNGITGEYILTIEGKCSVDGHGRLAVTCKVGPQDFEKHYLGISDNVTYFSQQIKSAKVSTYHTRIIFKPEAILPDFDIRLKQPEDL